MEFRLLGPLEVRDAGGVLVPLPRRQQRALLAALLVRAGEVVSIERLVDELWGDDPPASAVGSLQNAVAQLRKTLGADLVRTQPPGYVLAVSPEQVDARRFERLLGEAGSLEPTARAVALREALALWRGPALADLADQPWAEQEAARLEELRLTALEDRIAAELDLGRHAALVAQLVALAAEHPLRERLHRQLALSLYHSGRQAEALEACRAVRAALDELGLDPSAELRNLERDILQQKVPMPPPAEEAGAAPPDVPGERRVVSVLAASVPEDEDPEALRASLDRVLDVARAAVRRHGGELERFGPEGLTAVFGAEGSREDDALRAVRAAVELHKNAGVSAGVATGEAVVTGPSVSVTQSRVAGAAVARAAGLARSGEGVLVDPRTLELVRDSVTVQTAGPLARVLTVDAVRPEDRSDTPLLGRADELARLRQAFDTTREESRCRTLTVVGEAGIGKTRIARELVTSLDATVLVGRCAAYGEGATFLPLVDALRGVEPAEVLAGEDDADLVVGRVDGLAGPAPEPGSVGESYWAVRRLLEALARRRPVALVLDDVHWAEPALLDLVEYLADRVTDAPLLVLCLARPELLDARPGRAAEALRLGPLPEAETRELVDLTAELEEEARERIVELAEGNPLYAQQLAAYADEAGKGLVPGAMPASIDAVLAGRLGRLESGERATLQRAAVVGREFSRGAVAALAPPDLAVDAHLLALARRGLVRATAEPLPGDDAYRFHHVLLRDAAYATLTKEQRADLHEKVAAWLDRDGPGDDALAGYHLEQAIIARGEMGTELAHRAGARLGDAAMRVWRTNDAATAIGLLERATRLLPASPRKAELSWELWRALRVAGRETDATGALDQAEADAATSGSSAVSARVMVDRALQHLHAGVTTPRETEDQLLGAIAVLRQLGDERGLAIACLGVHAALQFSGRNAEAADAARRARDHYERAGFSPAAALACQAQDLVYGPDPVRKAIAECNAIRASTTDRASAANVMAVLGTLLGLDGRVAEGRTVSDQGLEIYEDLGYHRGIHLIWAPVRIELERAAGSLAEAARLGQAAYEAIEELGFRGFAGTQAAYLAAVLLELGNAADAAHFLDVARSEVPTYDVQVVAVLHAVEARILSSRRRFRQAEERAREAVELADATDNLTDRARIHLALADVLRQRGGRDEEADDAVTEARRLFRRKGNRAALARILDGHRAAIEA